MSKKRISILLAVALFVITVLTACGSNDNSNNNANNGANNGAEQTIVDKLSGKRIALIMQFNTGTFSAQYVEGVKDQVEKFGGEVTVFVADNDLAKMSSNLDAAINQKFDGILIDHGTAEALEAGVKRAISENIPVVAFDAILNVDGITNLEQADVKMAEVTLEKLAQDIGGKGNIVKIWVAGFAPMERRQIAYDAFLNKYTDIKEIAAFGNANAPALDAQTQMEAILKKYPKGEISAVWAAWDEFAKGASRAIEQAGRTEIKVYGIDLSDEDLQFIQDQDGPWVASAAVDPTDIGRVQVRFLYQQLNGDAAESNVILEPVFVTRDDLPKDKQINTSELGQYVNWGGSQQGYNDALLELENELKK